MRPLKSLGLTEVDEIQGTTQEIARHKCKQAAQIVPLYFCTAYASLADLSSLKTQR